MKNYIIGLLIVINILLLTIVYKQNITMIPKQFPIIETNQIKTDALQLYIFFKKNNCRDCLEIVEVLNRLSSHFNVTGVVPENNLKEEKLLRELTGAKFRLITTELFKKFIPPYSPCIIGINPNNNEILFILPGVPGEKEYLENFLESFYLKNSTIRYSYNNK